MGVPREAAPTNQTTLGTVYVVVLAGRGVAVECEMDSWVGMANSKTKDRRLFLDELDLDASTSAWKDD